ncbi:MAG: molybdopterin molybdotransferase MoeA [Deltaproteobacteria bacterium]|nr:molybdopterin molybdotransferase MoeA [Deltaproteobacteria bacterium]
MITVEKALETILAHISALGTERVDIRSSRGRVLSEDIVSSLTIPPLDNSSMDGYAVRAADVAGAAPGHPITLTVTGDLPAGYIATRALGEGQALRIMTGAPLPEGADTVIMRENTQSQGSQVTILQAEKQGTNIRRAGEDIKKGALLFPAGTVVRPAHIGIMASIQRAMVSVYQRPRVAILSTGDELVDIDEALGPGKIISSNSYSLATLVEDAGGTAIMLGIARDTKKALRSRMLEGMHADIILSSGGVSVGDYDFVKDVLQDLGIDMKFWKVLMRPGQPLAFGVIGGKPAFGLPGNPVSAMVSFEQFVRPAMRKMSGHTKLFRPLIEAVAQEDVPGRPDRKFFVRCRLAQKEGQWHAATTGEQGSGILMSMAEASGLMIIPETVERIRAGDRVRVQVLDPELGYSETPRY